MDFPRSACEKGLKALKSGDAQEALSLWESISPYSAPSERLSAVIICLRANRVVDSEDGYRHWLEDLGSKGVGRAAILLASDYLRAAIVAKRYGEGAESDDARFQAERCKYWLDVANGHGEPDALWLWSIIYAEGIGVEADQSRAHQLVVRAAEAGSASAIERIAQEE
jgi:TPR repeat protein